MHQLTNSRFHQQEVLLNHLKSRCQGNHLKWKYQGNRKKNPQQVEVLVDHHLNQQLNFKRDEGL